MKVIEKLWPFSLIALLSSNQGTIGPEDEDEEEEEDSNEGDEGDEGDEEDGDEEDGDDAEDDEEETEDGDADSGNDGGKDRSEYIPRKRFDKVNAKARQIDRLVELGVLVEGTDGELHVAKTQAKKGSEEADDNAEEGGSYYFKEADVDKESWPLVQKINKGFKKFDTLANKLSYTLIQLQSENAILRDYPEFLQKESPLRKRAMQIIKDDPEFKKTYRGNPEAGYWAVKRAAELIAGRKSTAPTKKPKSKFITGKGDGKTGGSNKPAVDLSKMTAEQLDDLERKEHARQTAANRNRKMARR